MRIIQMTRKCVGTRKFPYNADKTKSYHWTYVLRHPKGDKIAEGMELALKTKSKIKYDNGSKSTQLYTIMKPLKWDMSKLTKTAYVNCCVIVSIACRYAGIKTPKKCSSRTMYKQWKKYGFEIIPYKKGMKLKRGDILTCTTQEHPHTAVVKC